MLCRVAARRDGREKSSRHVCWDFDGACAPPRLFRWGGENLSEGRDVGAGGCGGSSPPPQLEAWRLSTPNFMHGTKSAPKFIRKFAGIPPEKITTRMHLRYRRPVGTASTVNLHSSIPSSATPMLPSIQGRRSRGAGGGCYGCSSTPNLKPGAEHPPTLCTEQHFRQRLFENF